MISVMIEEFREWKLRFAGMCFIILPALAGGTLLISKMHFIYFFFIVVLFFMWVGWQDGSQRWNEIKYSRGRNAKKIDYAQWFGGKHLGFLAISLIHTILLLPMVFLMILLWGIPASLCLCMLGIGIASGAMTLTFCILTQWINFVFGALLSVAAVMIWLLSGYFLPHMAPVNPLLLIVNLVDTGDLGQPLWYIGGCFAFQIVLAAIMQLPSPKAKREA